MEGALAFLPELRPPGWSRLLLRSKGISTPSYCLCLLQRTRLTVRTFWGGTLKVRVYHARMLHMCLFGLRCVKAPVLGHTLSAAMIVAYH
jgi:hypothetical protein